MLWQKGKAEMEPIVSVIMPVYNTEKYLDRAVQSVIGQTIENWELILVDDGSEDHSAQICEEYARKDRRIKTLHLSNSGAGAARNAGLSEACGDYVFFCDSDDWMEKTYLQVLVSGMHPDTDMVYSNFTVETEKGSVRNVSGFDLKEYDLSDCHAHRTFIAAFFKNCIGHTLWSRLFRKRIIDENHIRFVHSNRAEDMAFLILYLSFCGSKIRGVADAGYHYVLRAGSLTKKKDTADHLPEYIAYSRNMYGCLKDNRCIMPVYPLLFYYFIQPELQRTAKMRGFKSVREIFLHTEGYAGSEKTFFTSLYEEKEKYGRYLDRKEYQEIRNICEYLLYGSKARLRLKNRLLYMFKG
jgi:glycosyltransferase involved in cell wall biosynthesis